MGKGKTLYLDCASGISGDMVVGALLDLGANEAGLRRALDSLNVDGFDVVVSRKQASGIDACDFDVQLDEAHEAHDHDMAYLYGDLDGEAGRAHHHGEEVEHHDGHHHDDEQQEAPKKGKKAKREKKRQLKLKRRLEKRLARKRAKGHGDADDAAPVHAHAHEDDHVHVEPHGHEHHHDHGHAHDHGHHHVHRSPADVAAIIDAADLAPRAKTWAHRIFDIVAQAEAKAHGLPLEQVHFHEVGAVDSIVDVVSVAYCLDDLDVTDAYVSPLAEGHGRVRCAHGVLSVPVPAVTNIVAEHGLVLEPREVHGELVTPTGAAIAAAIKTMDALPARYRVLKTGLGSGKRAYNPPSTVRALVIEELEEAVEAPVPTPAPVAQTQQSDAHVLGAPDLWKLETELDDCTGEALGNVTQLLYDAGALEVHYLPVFMKKGRPGYQIEVLCVESSIAMLESVIFENTTTIGIRRCPEWRTALPREQREIETGKGTLRVKVVTLPGGAQRAYPEHDSMAQLAEEAGVSYQDVLREAMAALMG